MKKFLTILLALTLMAAGTAFAVEGFHETGYPIVDTPASYTIMMPRSLDMGEPNDMWVFDFIREELGIDFTVNSVDMAAWNEKLGLTFATGDLPDMFLASLSASDVIMYGGQGFLLDIRELVEQYAPNIMEVFEVSPEALAAHLTPDGHMYGLRYLSLQRRELSRARSYINSAWLEALDLEMPTTVDALYDVLKAFKEGDPNGNGEADEIPMGGLSSNDSLSMKLPILSAFGFVSTGIQLGDDGKVFYVPVHENYKEYLAYMKKLYQDGLLDEEYFSQTNDQNNAKLASGLYGLYQIGGANFTASPDAEIYKQYVMYEPLTSAVNDTKMWPGADVGLGSFAAITEDAENPEILVRFLDYCWSADGLRNLRYGIENGTWEGGEGGYEWVTLEDGTVAVQLVYDSERFSSYNDFRTKELTPMTFPTAQVPIHYADTEHMDEEYFTAAQDVQVMLSSDILTNAYPYLKTAFPELLFTDEENEEISLIVTELDTYIKQMEAKFIIGDEPLESFDAFVAQVEARNVGRLVEIYQTVYDRSLEN